MPIVADEARTFGTAHLFKQVGIYSFAGNDRFRAIQQKRRAAAQQGSRLDIRFGELAACNRSSELTMPLSSGQGQGLRSGVTLRRDCTRIPHRGALHGEKTKCPVPGLLTNHWYGGWGQVSRAEPGPGRTETSSPRDTRQSLEC